MNEEAFQESTNDQPIKSAKSLKLSLNPDGSIDWDTSAEKHKTAFIKAIEIDPNGILDNIREQAGTTTPDDEPSGIADASVLTVTNLVMCAEALLITAFGHKIAPPLKNLHPVIAIKACAVTMDEIKPIMPAAKRIMKRYIPVEYLGQEYQDIAICAEHLMKLSAAKFKSCVDLAMEIEKMKQGAAHKPNGHVTIDAEPVGQA